MGGQVSRHIDQSRDGLVKIIYERIKYLKDAEEKSNNHAGFNR